MAAQTVDRVVTLLKKRGMKKTLAPAPTDREPLPGGEARDFEPLRQQGLETGLSKSAVDHLVHHYGTEAAAIFNLARTYRELREQLHPQHPMIAAEVIHHVRRELAQTIEDVLVRRVHLFYEVRDHGLMAAPRVAELMGGDLRWDDLERNRQVEAYRSFVRTQRSNGLRD
jgi:glycerol-3-phosphate dehydrogenase